MTRETGDPEHRGNEPNLSEAPTLGDTLGLVAAIECRSTIVNLSLGENILQGTTDPSYIDVEHIEWDYFPRGLETTEGNIIASLTSGQQISDGGNIEFTEYRILRNGDDETTTRILKDPPTSPVLGDMIKQGDFDRAAKEIERVGELGKRTRGLGMYKVKKEEVQHLTQVITNKK